VLVNILVITPLAGFANYFTGIPVNHDFSVEGIPTIYKFVAQNFFCVFVLDFLFHMNHRLFHHPFVYKRLHKIHHEYKVSIFCATVYCHPIEMLVCNIFPSIAGPLILGKSMHVTAVTGWLIPIGVGSIVDHCGYEFTWSPFRLVPFTCDYGYHVFHHSHNVGNFSTFFHFWDTILGSNNKYYQ